MEQAAESLGASRVRSSRRIILPNLLPAIIAGCGLAFARAVGEFRLARAHHQQPPLQGRRPRTSSSLLQVESDNPIGASAVSVVLLVAALLILLLFGWLSKRALRR